MNYLCIIFTTCRRLPRPPLGLHPWTPLGPFTPRPLIPQTPNLLTPGKKSCGRPLPWDTLILLIVIYGMFLTQITASSQQMKRKIVLQDVLNTLEYEPTEWAEQYIAGYKNGESMITSRND